MLFLIGIFIIVGSLDKLSFPEDFSGWLMGMGLSSAPAALLLLVWLSVGLSSFIDNVPYTVLMVPLCAHLSQMLGTNPYPLYYGMLVGTGIGGNLTPVGATANILACGMLEKRGRKVGLWEYMKLSIAFSLSAVLAAQLLLQFFWF